jgi:hypothetical protein
MRIGVFHTEVEASIQGVKRRAAPDAFDSEKGIFRPGLAEAPFLADVKLFDSIQSYTAHVPWGNAGKHDVIYRKPAGNKPAVRELGHSRNIKPPVFSEQRFKKRNSFKMVRVKVREEQHSALFIDTFLRQSGQTLPQLDCAGPLVNHESNIFPRGVLFGNLNAGCAAAVFQHGFISRGTGAAYAVKTDNQHQPFFYR